MRSEYDVLVAGGGPAGFPAAAQAARLGARTLLVEKNGALGGTTTVAGVALPGLFHAWGRQIIAGIGWEAVRRSTELAGIELPDFTAWERPHFKLQVPVVPAIYAAVIDDVVLTSGCDLLLHSTVVGVRRTGDDRLGWEVLIGGKEGVRSVWAAALVDATGDADLVGQAGLPRLRNPERQPGTLMVRLGGYDPADLDYEVLDKAYEKAVAAGRIHKADLAHNSVRGFLRRRGENAIHVPGVDGGTSESRTAAELAARRTLLRIVDFFRRQPGLSGLTVLNWAVECGIRETFTIDGHTRITAEDYTTGRAWRDAVSYSFYPVDVHRPDGDGIDIRPLPYGTLPTIPRAAMIPKGARGMVVAGRAVSGDQEANSAYRVQASCMAMGQAAGVLAARSVERRTEPLDLDISQIRFTLREQGAIVPGDVEIGAINVDSVP